MSSPAIDCMSCLVAFARGLADYWVACGTHKINETTHGVVKYTPSGAPWVACTLGYQQGNVHVDRWYVRRMSVQIPREQR